jgi:CheY-like chemotaxis protein
LDHNLPDGDGIDFIERLGRDSGSVPIIMLTGQGDETLAVRSMKAGAADYLIKDQLTHTRLSATVGGLIQHLRLGEEHTRRERAMQELVAGTTSAVGADLFTLLVGHLGPALEADLALVATVHGDRHAEVLGADLSGTAIERFTFAVDRPPWRAVLLGNDPRLIQMDELDIDEAPLPVPLAIAALLAMPLRAGDGQVCGLVAVAWTDAGRAKVDDEVLPVFAARASSEMERLAMLRRLERARSIDRSLIGAAEALLGPGSLRNRLTTALRSVARPLECNRVSLFRYPEGTSSSVERVLVAAVAPPEPLAVDETVTLYWRDGLLRWQNTFCMAEPISGRVRSLPQAEQQGLLDEGVLTVLAIPIMAEGRPVGFLRFDDCLRGRSWLREDIDQVRAISGLVSAVVQRDGWNW